MPFVAGCINDLKVNEIFIPLSELIRPIVSDVQREFDASSEERNNVLSETNLSIVKQQNVIVGCAPNRNPCSTTQCVQPFECVDEWMLAKCRFGFCFFFYTKKN